MVYKTLVFAEAKRIQVFKIMVFFFQKPWYCQKTLKKTLLPNEA